MSKAIDLLLPLGSVVRLKGGKTLLIITGYLPNDKTKENVFYDYDSNVFPIGRLEDKLYLFNHEDIDEVMFIGYQTEESIKYRETVGKVRTNLKKGLSLEEALKKATEK